MADKPIKYNSQIEKDQSDDSANIVGKRSILFGWNPNTLQYEKLTSTNGLLNKGGLNLPTYDYMSYTATDSVTDTYVFKTGGAGGTLVATLVLVFTDSTKTQIASLTRS